MADARTFGNFLAGRLKEALHPLENNILNLVSQDLDKNTNQLYRSAGARDMLQELITKLEPLVQDFYNTRNSGAAADMPVPVSGTILND